MSRLLLASRCQSSDFAEEQSPRVLYLTSVLSKSSPSTAEKFGAGFTQLLGSWVISGRSSAHPVKDGGQTGRPFPGPLLMTQ